MIFIFGANGMLGNYVLSYLKNLYQVVPLTRKDYDLSSLNIESLESFLISKDIKENDIIINCAGIIPQSQKDNKKEYYLINGIFPIVLSLLCVKYRAKFIHITTDCVFSGKEGNYNENDISDEKNDYGVSKSLGDISLGTIIRTSIIGEERNNKRSLLEWVLSNKDKEINGYIDHHWNGVTCLQLAKIIHEIIDKNLFWDGIRHIFSPTPVTKYSLLEMFNEIYNLNIKINKKYTDLVDKTLSTIYENNFKIPELYDQILELKNFQIH